MYSQAIASAQLEKSCFCYNKLKLSNWRRVDSFTLEALELEMQSGIIVQQAEALELEKSCFFYSEGSRTRDAIRY